MNDANRIKSISGLAEFTNNTFIVLGEGFINDTSFNPSLPVRTGLEASVLAPDNQPPMLAEFVLDLTDAAIVLTFDEPVDASTLDVTGFAIVPARGREDLSRTIALTNGTVSFNAFKDVITIALTTGDFNLLRATVGVGEDVNNTFLTVAPDTIQDTFGNTLDGIPVSSAVQASSIVPDRAAPVLLTFDIDLRSGTLVLEFDEPISTSLDVTGFALREPQSDTPLTLSPSTGFTSSLTTLTFTLRSLDLNTLKTFTDLNNTRLEVSSGAISDNANNTVTTSLNVSVSTVICDSVSPELAMFHINMTSGIISLFFDETVDIDVFDATAVTILDAETEPNSTFVLTGGTVSRPDAQPNSVLLQVSDVDLSSLKSLDLCSNVSSCYINFTIDLVRDVCGNPISPTPNNTAVRVSQHAPDTIQPEVSAFSVFDLDEGRITLLFSEPVDVLSLDVNRISVQSFSVNPTSEVEIRNLASYCWRCVCHHERSCLPFCVQCVDRYLPCGVLPEEYSTCSVPHTCPRANVQISFDIVVDPDPLDQIKLNPQLCTDFPNCYINIPNGTVVDVAGNPSVASVTMLTTFIPDTTGPQLRSFELDLNTDQVTLSFDEIVNPSTLDFTAITFQSDVSGTFFHTLSGGNRITTSSSPEVVFSLLKQDLDILKATTGLAESRNTTFITFTPDMIDDLSGNDVQLLICTSNTTEASVYQADTDPVSLDQFSEFDLGAETLTLSFTEPVDIDTLDYSEITLLSEASTNGSSVTLNTGSATYVDTATKLSIVISLSEADTVSIKLDPSLATSAVTTYISLGAGAIKDVAGNTLNPVIPAAAERVVVYNPDRSETSLTNFTVDMNDGRMSFTFDDVADIGSIIGRLITLQNTVDGSTGVSQTLDSISLISTQSGFVIDFRLGQETLEAVQMNTELAISSDTTFLSLDFAAIRDYQSAPVRRIESTSALPVGSFVADTTRPVISRYSLDVDQGVLSLTFTEVVNLTAIDLTQLTIQNAANSSESTQNVTLNGGTFDNNPASSVNVTLLDEDLDAIKTMMELATNGTTTYLAATNSTVQDMVGNPLVEISGSNAKMSAQHQPDSSKPTLDTFFLDLNSGLLSLTFSEAVLVSSFNPTSIGIQSSRTAPAVTVTVNGGTVITTDMYSSVIRFYLDPQAVSDLNADPRIALSDQNTFVTISDGAVVDTRGFGSVAILSSNALSGSFSLDSTAPILQEFSIDFQLNQLLLTFNEPVLSSTFNATYFTIVSQSSATPRHSYMLTSGSVAMETGPGGNITLTISLSDEDVFGLNAIPQLATSQQNTLISLLMGAVTDIYLNPIDEISPSAAVRVTNYTADVTPPVLYSFSVDLDEGVVVLNISEAVNLDTFNFSQITLTNNDTTPVSYTLTGGSSTQSLFGGVVIELSDSDEFALKIEPDLITSITDTFLVATAFAFEDGAGNNFGGIDINLPLQAVAATGDLSAPEITAFRYLTPGDRPGVVIVLEFSEVVNISSFDVTAVTIQPTGDGVSTESPFTLTGGDYLMENAQVLRINVTETDRLVLESRSVLGTSISTTYLSVTAGAVRDATGRSFPGIPTSLALQAVEYTVDLVSPQLLDYTFDFNEGSIILTFDENVDPSSFQPTEFLILASTATPAVNVSLSGYRELVASGNNILTLVLSPEDYDILNTNDDIAVSINTTFITVNGRTLTDFATNPLVPRSAVQAAVYIPDTSPPSLESFEFNLNDGILTLQFTETVRVSSFNSTAISLQNRRSSPTESLTLSGGTYANRSASVVKVTLTNSDLVDIKSLTNLGTSIFNTFISIPPYLAADLSGMNVVSIPTTNALRASQFNNDTVPPNIVSFDLDFTNGIIALSFDEVVDLDSFNPSALSFQSQKSQLEPTYTLTGGTTFGNVSNVVDFQLSEYDLNQLKQNELCVERNGTGCFISFTSDLVTDTFQLSVNPVNSTNSEPVLNYLPDVISPSLTEFVAFDANSAVLTLMFSETVNVSTLNFSAIVIQSYFEDPQDVLRLTDGTVTVNATTVTITLSEADAIRLKLDSLLCARRGTCFVTLDEEAVKDQSGNPSLPTATTPPGFGVQEFTPDEMPPQLDSYDLDMNIGKLTLYFSEIVDKRTFQPSGLSFQPSSTQQLPNYRLTGGNVTSAMFSSVVMVMLSETDLTGIKATEFAKSNDSTFLSILSSTISELSADARKVVARHGVIVNSYIRDSVPPMLLTYTLDLNANILTLDFNEPMNVSTLSFGLIDLHSESSGGVSYSLTDGVITTQDQARTITIALSSEDVVFLKLNGSVGTSASNTFVTINSQAVDDQAGNPISTATQAGTLVPDNSRMRLTRFVLDLFLGQIHLTFDDLALASTFDPSGITLQDAPTGTTFVTLTANTSTSSTDGYVIIVDLSLEDRGTLSSTPGVGSALSNSYLAIDGKAIMNWDTIPVQTISNGNAIQAAEFISASNGSQLLEFSLNLNTSELLLVFNNPVDSSLSNINASLIVLRDLTGTSLYPLDSIVGSRTEQSGQRIFLQLTTPYLNSLKLNPNIATSLNGNDTYISLSEGAFIDLDGGPVTLNGTIPATELIPDEISPMLVQFVLDLNDGLLNLTFDEIVAPETLNASFITIQSGPNQTLLAEESIRLLGGGTTSSSNGVEVSIVLLLDDQDFLKSSLTLATTIANTYLATEYGLIQDTFGNPMEPISIERAKMASSVILDKSPPEIGNVTLDLNKGTLVFVFSEVVQRRTLSASKVTLFGIALMDSDLNPLGTEDSSRVEAALVPPFLYTIQEYVASTDMLNATVEVATGLVLDYGNFSSLGTNVTASLVPDNTSSLLEEFNVDLSTGTISLTFNEVINRDSFNPTLVRLQNREVGPSETLQLSNDTTFSIDRNVINITLTLDDFESLTLASDFGTGSDDTFAFLDTAAVEDLFGKALVMLHQPARATSVVEDTSPPMLLSVTVDMGMGELILEFNEAINASSVDLSGVTLHNSTSLTPSFSLSSSSVLLMDSRMIAIDIQSDLLMLREMMVYGSSINSTFISILPNLIIDFGGNAFGGTGGPIMVDLLNPDNVGPILLSFDLDMDSGELVLHFDENVMKDSFNSTSIMLQSAGADAVHVQYSPITSTSVTRENFSDIIISLDRDDVDRLNTLTLLATNRNNTFMSYSGMTVADLLGNRGENLPAEMARQVSIFTPDETNPRLDRLEVDLNASTISLVLNEVPDPNSLNISLLQLQDNEFGNGTVLTFTEYSDVTIATRRLIIHLTTSDSNRLKLQPICSELSDCFVTVETGVATDMAGNPVLATGPLMASNITEDNTRPALVQFIIMDLDTGVFELSFSEVVNVASVQLQNLKFQSQHLPMNSDYREYTVTGSNVTSMDSDLLVVELDRADLNSLKREPLLCSRSSDCYVRFNMSFLTDLASNPVESVVNTIESDTTHYPIRLIRDTTGPIVTSFNLDLELRLLAIDFDELININVFVPEAITLQDSAIASTNYTLTGGTVLMSNDTGILLQLDPIDNGLIKADRQLATMAANTYLTHTSRVVTDVSSPGNVATVRENGRNALPVSGFVDDITAPTLITFSQFNLETGIISLSFSEPIDAVAVNHSLITLQSSSNISAGVSRILSGEEPASKTTVRSTDPNILDLYLSFDDLLFVKQSTMFAISSSTTYLSFDREAFADTAGNILDTDVPSSAAISPDVYLSDALPATLMEFGIDMDSGLLQLTFSDIVQPMVFDPLSVTFQNTAVNPTLTYTLTNGTSVSNEALSFVLEAQIIEEDLINLKHTIGLLTSIQDSFISVTTSVTQNPDGSAVSATTSGVQATSFFRDTTPGNLTAFSLDLDRGVLNIRATEPLDPASFTPSGLTLQNSANISAMNVVHLTLTGGTARQSNSSIYQLEVSLSSADLNALKEESMLATMRSDVFLSADSTAFADFGATPINPVSNMAALVPTNYSGDLSSPGIERAVLDLNNGEFRLYFDEVVDLATLDFSSITLQTDSNGSSATSETFMFERLTLLTTSPNNLSAVIAFELTAGDLDALKLHNQLGYNGSTYVSFADGIVRDSNGFPLDGYPPETALIAWVSMDSTPPSLLIFSPFDLDEGTLELIFDEPVDATTFESDAGFLEVLCGSEQVITFASTTATQESARNISFSITSAEQRQAIELSKGFCSNICFNYTDGSRTGSLIQDISGNGINTAGTINVSLCIPDQTRPAVLSFTLDVNTGTIVMSFTEPVSLANHSLLAFQNAFTPLYSYSLQEEPANITFSASGTLATITLTAADLDGIKATPFTATQRENTYLSVSERAFTDTYRNPVNDSVIPASSLIQDNVIPVLQRFEFGAHDGQLTLSLFFTEPMNYTSLDLTGLTLYSSASGSLNYTLVYSEPLPIYGSVIRIPLEDSDTDEILLLTPLGETNESTYLVVMAAAILDMQGLAITSFGPAPAVNSQYNLDPPILESFWLNLQTRLMQFVFSTPVVASTFDGTHITIQSTNSSSAVSFTFVAGGTAMDVNGSIVLVRLATQDLDGLQSVPGLATSTNDTFISLTRGLIQDSSGLAIRPIPTTSALQADNFTADTSVPQLVGFTLSLNGLDPLILTFSETVIAATFMPNLLYLLSAPDNTSTPFYFSNATVISGSGTIIEIAVPLADKNRLQLIPDIANSENDTYISIGEGVFQDADGLDVLPLPPEQALKADRVIPDEEPPRIFTFDLNVDTQSLVLFVSEPVSVSSFNSTGYTLQNVPTNPTASYTLTLTSTLNRVEQLTMVYVDVSDDDLNEIKARGICTSETVCFLTYTEDAISDAVGQKAENTTTGIQVGNLQVDSYGPTLASFDAFDFGQGTLTISFNETILVGSFNASAIVIQSIFDSANMSLTLSGGTVLTTDSGRTVTVKLEPEDIIDLQLSPFLCTARGNCYVSLNSGAVTDVQGNPFVPSDEGLIATQFTRDRIRPSITNFTLDMDEGQILLTFSEPISIEIFDISGLGMQGNATGPTSVTFTSGTMTAESGQNGRFVNITLSTIDLNSLKAAPVATSLADTFLTATSQTTRDLALPPNSLIEIPTTSALQARMYIDDKTPPSLLEFNLDLNQNTVELVFNEPLNESRLDLSLFTIYSTIPAATQNVTLSQSSVISVQTAEVSRILLTLSEDDIVALKSYPLCEANSSNTFLDVENNAAFDASGITLLPLTAVNVTAYQSDTESPRLSSFSLDLTIGQLNLTFDDVVDFSTFDPTGITLQGGQRKVAGEFFTLTTQSRLASSANFGYMFTVNLNRDSETIRLNSAILNDPHLTMLASTVDDCFKQDVIAVTDGKALRVSSLIVDQSQPEVSFFDLDLNTGILVVEFTDILRSGSVNITGFTLQDGMVASSGNTYTLTTPLIVPLVLLNTTTISLSSVDINGIKAIRNLASRANNTYLTVVSHAATDISGNPTKPILNGSAVMVRTYRADTTSPVLRNFVLDLDRGIVELTFSEVVDPLTLDPSEIAIQDTRDARFVRSTSVALEGSSLVSTVPSAELDLRLSIDSLRDLSFAMFPANTYITMTSDSATDMAGNEVTPISTALALQAASVEQDVSQPTLESFDFDLGLGTATLTLSKPVLVGSLNISQLTLLSNSPPPTPVSVPLMQATTNSEDGSVIVIQFSYSEANTLRQSTTIATSIADTYIEVGSNFAEDLNGRQVVPIASQQASSFAPDDEPPRVTEFVLDLNLGLLNLTFDEPVSDIQTESVILQNSLMDPSSSISLTNSTLTGININMVAIELSEFDLDAIKSELTLVVSNITSFITFDVGGVTDMINNTIVTTPTAVMATDFIDDAVPPSLLGFTWNLGSEVLLLTFDDVVSSPSVNFTQLTLVSNRSMMFTSYSLTSESSVLSPSGRVLELYLLGVDGASIKALTDLGTERDNTYLSFTTDFISDPSGNKIFAVDQSVAVQASQVFPDTTPPELRGFVLNLSNNELALTFTETVLIDTLNLTEITLQASRNGSGMSLTLLGGYYRRVNTGIVVVSLLASDANSLKDLSVAGIMAYSVESTYISLTSDTGK